VLPASGFSDAEEGSITPGRQNVTSTVEGDPKPHHNRGR
jgi:hypothetical protein